jgi:hypothetical protein
LGRRIAKKIGGVTTQKYLWQDPTRLLAVLMVPTTFSCVLIMLTAAFLLPWKKTDLSITLPLTKSVFFERMRLQPEVW